MKFHWEETLVLNVPLMDKQHMELVEQADKLFEALGDPAKSTQEINEMLKFLADYVVNHFNAEERLQRQYNYPDYEKHHEIHEAFKATVSDLIKSIEADGLKTTKKLAINKMVMQWLKQHIGVEDRKLAVYIHSQEKG